MTRFIKGLDLSEVFYGGAVKPILRQSFPSLEYSAGRLDDGSDVLGYDTPQSMDHDWGPRLTLFVSEIDYKEKAKLILRTLGMELPLDVLGFSTHFASNKDQTSRLAGVSKRPIRHAVKVTTKKKFFADYFGMQSPEAVTGLDWLLMPQQKLRTLASGRLFQDDLKIGAIRKKLVWYPRDLWLHLMACQWQRISQEEPFVGRCGDVGDELGSRILVSRLLSEVMKLCFLMERQYAPYSKWFGTAFKQLECSREFLPLIEMVLDKRGWRVREKAMGKVYVALLKKHNRLKLTPKIKETLSPFFTRPYQVPGSHRVVAALFSQIKSSSIRKLPRNIGSIDQLSDSIDVVSHTKVSRRLETIYLPSPRE